MNNITVDNTRAVVADVKSASPDQAKEPAKSGKQSGKDMPPAAQVDIAQASAKAAEASQASAARMEKAVEQLNNYVQSTQRDLQFSLDEDLGRTVVRVLDRNTQEVIRQIPNETALQLARNLKAIEAEEMQKLQSTPSSADASLGLINTRI